MAIVNEGSLPAYIRRRGVAYVMREGEYWQGGKPPPDAPIVGMRSGRVYDTILRDLGYGPWRRNHFRRNRQRRLGFERMRLGKPFLNRVDEAFVRRWQRGF